MNLQRYYSLVADLGCCVTRSHADVTLHHVHGGSVRGIVPRKMSRRYLWLVIPLVAPLHAIGPDAIDGSLGVKEWERRFGAQLDHLRFVQEQTGVDAFARCELVNPWPYLIERKIP